MQLKNKILLVEDDPAIVTLLEYNLVRAGYHVGVATDGDSAISMAMSGKPDLVLLDWMLPNRSGINVCRTLRAHPTLQQTAIIMLTAKGEERDVEQGLREGADDYIRKPFSIVELMARIEAQLRSKGLKSNAVQFGDLSLDMPSQQASFRGTQLALKRDETLMLFLLASKPQQIFERSVLREYMGNQLGETQVQAKSYIDNLLKRLRATLSEQTGRPYIRLVHGVGYVFEA